MGTVRELPLSEFGLETVENAASRRNQHPTTLRKLVAVGVMPAVVVGAGRSARYLLRPADVDALPVKTPGRPTGTKDSKPRKSRASRHSKKKSG